jgi:hypothetical protein
MQVRYRTHLFAAVVILRVWAICPAPTWGQEPASPRVGPVLEIEHWVRYRKDAKTNWENAQVDQLIIRGNRMWTGARSKTSIQLENQRRVETLGERTEAYFHTGLTKCVIPGKTPSEVRITQLTIGLIHLVTNIFEAILTPNSTTCVHGTAVLVHFTTPPDTTEVINLVGTVTVRKQRSDQDSRESIELPANSRVLVVGPPQDSVFVRDHSDVVFLDERRHEEPVPDIGCGPQTCYITTDTQPPLSLLDLTVRIPR